MADENIDPEKIKKANEQQKIYNQTLAEQVKLQEEGLKKSDRAVIFAENEVGMRNKAISLVRQMNDLLQDEQISLESLSKNERNIRKDKEIQNKLDEVKNKQAKLKLQQSFLNEETEADLIANLQTQIDLGDQAIAGLKMEGGLRDKMNKDIGIFDNILRGIQDIPFFGDLGIASEMEDTLESAASTAAIQGKSLGTMGKMKALAGPLGKAMKGAIGPALWAMVIDAVLQVDKELVEMSKSLNMSKKEAGMLRSELGSASHASGDLFVTTEKMIGAQNDINKALGTAAVFSGEILVKATQLLEKVKLTGEATAGLAAQSVVAGGAFKDTYENALATSYEMQTGTGIAVDLRRVMEQVGTTTGSLRAQLNGSTEEIAKAVTNAEMLGMELQTAADAGRTLLDFESSIEKELEAELLTGKQLNLERARAAALAGDQVTLQNELAANMGNFSDFTKMNVLQQESLAAAMGMSSDTLSDILFKQEVQGRTARELRALGKDELADRLEATTQQDKFNAMMSKLQSIIADIVTPLIPLLDLVGSVFSLLGPLVNILNPIIQGLMVIVTSIVDVIGSIPSFLTGGKGDFSATKSQYGTYEQSFEDSWGMKVNDFKLETNPEDTIMIDNKNNVVAGGTNLGGNNLSKDDLIEALRTVEKEKPKQNLIIREKDSNYADANPINSGGDSYQIKYETSFS